MNKRNPLLSAKHALVLSIFLLVLAVNASGQSGAHAASSCAQCPVWNKEQKPFRVYGNTYYVGPHGLTSLLITSKAGHVLIDGALPESVPQIVANIRSLGFRIEDVKLIVNSHVHFDHGGGIAELQRLSGARVAASPWSAEVLTKSGVGKGDPQFGSVSPLALVPRADTLQDGQTLRVGDIELKAHFTPGHTPGGTSWTWRSCEGRQCLNLVYADSMTPVSSDGFRFTDSREYPNAVQDFEKSFAFLRAAPCDILLTSHPDASGLWQRLEGRERGVRPDPLVSPNACKELADRAGEQLRQRLESEKGAQGTPAGELPRKGFAGVQVAPVPEDVRARLKLAASQGLLVGRVGEGTAAAEAGLVAGDVIVEAAGKPVGSPAEYVAVVGRMYAGDKLPLTVLREEKRLTLTLTLKPRPFETSPDFDILYRSVGTSAGRRRVIVTKPKGQGKFPAVLLVGGIGCYSLDGLTGEDAYGQILFGLTLKGFATMRVEKTGIGDSEGPPCMSPQADLRQEVAGNLAGLRALKSYDFVDPRRVFIIGHSIGGIVGPLVALEEPVRGLAVAETVGTNWFEYELANSRRQALLAGTPYDELERRAQTSRVCKQRLLLEKQTPERILKDAPGCAEFIAYPAPYTYVQQLADLNLAEVWKKVDARALIIYGSSDYLTSASEHEYLRDMLNSFRPGTATYVQIEAMGHGFERVASQRDYYEQSRGGAPLEFQTRVFDEVARWLAAASGTP